MVADAKQQFAARGFAHIRGLDARGALARGCGRGNNINLLRRDPCILGQPLRQAASLSEQAERTLIYARIHAEHVALLRAQVDEVRLRYLANAIHREYGVTCRRAAHRCAPDVDNICDLAESRAKVSGYSGPAALRNRLTKGGIPDMGPESIGDPAPRRLGDHS